MVKHANCQSVELVRHVRAPQIDDYVIFISTENKHFLVARGARVGVRGKYIITTKLVQMITDLQCVGSISEKYIVLQSDNY